MKKSLSLFALVCLQAHAQQISIPTSMPAGLPPLSLPPVHLPKDELKNANFSFTEIPVSQIILLLFEEINTKSFVLSTEVAEDKRLVSFRFDSKTDGKLENFLRNLLDGLGYRIEQRSNIYFVSKRADDVQEEIFDIYKPQYRSSVYLLNLLRPVFTSAFSSVSQVQNPGGTQNKEPPSSGSAAAMIDSQADQIIFHAKTKSKLDEIRLMLSRIDTQEQNYTLKAHIFEVTYSANDKSALSLLLNIANNKLKINIGTQSPSANFFQFSSDALSVLFENIKNDTRFKLVSNPYLRIKNGKQSVLNVGAQVPTLSSVSYQQNGQPVQSVEYKDTGLTFQITPTFKEKIIDIDLTQSISEVQNTTTGVNNTPTLTQRKLQTSFQIEKNQLVVLAGLKHDKTNFNDSRPILFPFFSSKSSSTDSTEIVVMIELQSESE
jgi:general secretion pathway protein D